MRRISGFIVALSLLLILAGSAWAGEAKVKVGGTVYFDYFMNTTDGADEGDDALRGFQFRRAYLTVKKSWGDMLFRYTTDIDGKYGTGNLNAYTKYAYLEHKGLIPGAALLIGQHSPKTHGWVEKRWHYRSMAKTLGDAQKWTRAAELGIGLQGKAADGAVEYYLDLNNGNGYKAPLAKDGLGLAGRLAFQPMDGLWLSGMFSSNTPGGTTDQADNYFEGLAGYDAGLFEIYAQYGQFTNGNTDGEESETGLSIFGRFMVMEGTYLLGRFDKVDPDTDTDDDGHSWLLAGLDWQLHEGLHLQPAFQLTQFEAEGADSESELRLTFYGKF